MAKAISLTRHLSFLLPHTPSRFITSSTFFHPLRFLSTTPTPYPLQYELIINRPDLPKPNPHRRTAKPPNSPEPNQNQPDSSLLDWADDKLTTEPGSSELDKSKRKYYNKRRKRLYGSDSDDDNRRNEEQFVEMKPEVVELRSLPRREEELHFYDAFAYPWEKDKHYRMVYQLEKKFFPNQCLDKAFLQPGQSNSNSVSSSNLNTNTNVNASANARVRSKKVGVFGGEKVGDGDNKLVFFEENVKGEDRENGNKVEKSDHSEKKVEEFFKGLKKEVEVVEPFFSSRRTGLPPVWDSPHGTVLLINKPKGWTSFTVCGKLRRLVKVKKVGHAGTLDPMATGLLIVCVGKSTKLVDRYQGMIKGYSGIFRLGEATSTWDADSPVIQREPWEHIKDEDIKKSALSFCGEIWQVPPMFSAIKVGGEKMYDKADNLFPPKNKPDKCLRRHISCGIFPCMLLASHENRDKLERFPMNEEIPPVKLFLQTPKDWSFFKEPISTGIFPISLLPPKNKSVRLEQYVKFVGISPAKKLLSRRSCCNCSNRPNSCGISPEKLLFLRLRLLRKVRLPTWGDKDPCNLYPSKFNSITL